jgi:hypothetical protein
MLQAVNFFGHACVATWYDAAPEFVLGAMLPDFFSMLRVKPAKVVDPRVARGVELHHATDAAFHSAEPFLGLTHAARSALSDAGLARGSARAVAHIGVEILLDEVLAGDERSREAYLAALSHARNEAAALDFHSAEEAARYVGLLSALSSRGVARDAVPEQVAERIERTLRGRPRLALADADRRRVSDWVVAARPDVVGCSSALLTLLRARLANAGFSQVRSDAPGIMARPT